MRERESQKEGESANRRARERENMQEKRVCETGRRGGEMTAYQGDFPRGADDQ